MDQFRFSRKYCNIAFSVFDSATLTILLVRDFFLGDTHVFRQMFCSATLDVLQYSNL